MYLYRKISIAPFIIGILLLSTSLVFAQSELHSPDGKFKAILVSKGVRDLHYRVIEIKTGRKILTTFAKFTTPNDVKAGLFSPDSKKFAAAYHYGHEGAQTWIGVWDIETGKLERIKMIKDWIRDISFIF